MYQKTFVYLLKLLNVLLLHPFRLEINVKRDDIFYYGKGTYRKRP